MRPGGKTGAIGRGNTRAVLAASLPAGESPLHRRSSSNRSETEDRVGLKARRELIAVMDSLADVQCVLAGRVIGTQVEYAWMRPRVMAEDASTLPAVLPARTDWLRSAKLLLKSQSG